MKMEYKVHGVSNGSANVQATVNGETINAAAPALEVELVPVSGNSGSTTLRVIGSQIEEAKSIFKPDALITADYTNKEAAKEGEKKPA